MEAAFFDLDKTVIARASMVAFGRPFYRNGMVSRSLVLRALYGQLVYLHLGADEAKLARMRESVLALTRGWEQARVSAIVRETLTDVVEPIIYAEALELIEGHRAAGRKVFIVSASPEEIVEPLAEFLGADQAIATRARVDAEGRYTGEVEYYAYGPAKAEAIRRVAGEQGLDLASSFAYSDSATDVPMLEAVGNPVAVNPDRELMRVARERGWEVRHFVRPVRLRDRMPLPSAGPTAAVAATVALAAGGVAWWRWKERGRAAERTAERTAADASARSTLLGAPRRLSYWARTFLAATAPRATSMTMSRSFFMAAPYRGRRPGERGRTRRGG
ncbi:MAG: HAD family hydrolase [Acidimicrobiales bacterium]